jgi:Rieske 2Fe-2S family protein
MLDLGKIAGLLDRRRPGCGLPRELYVDPDAFAFDMAAIFGRSWILVGFDVELAKPGAWMSASVGPWPIVLTRDRAGEIHAFHNVCRHRGARICAAGKGSAPRLVCPYHRWAYELSGELAHAARMPDGFAWEDHGLMPVRLADVGGALYVCVAEEPPDIGPFKRAMEPLMAPHRLSEAKLAFESVITEKANWKLAMENARECYHCPTAHPELSHSFPVGASAHFDFGEDRRQEMFAARMARLGLPIGPVEGDWWQAVRFTLNDGCRSMTMDGAPVVTRPMCPIGDGDIGSLRWATEPHAFVHAAADHLFMFSVAPLGPRETAVIGKWFVHRDAVEGEDYRLEDLTALWTRTNLQDRDLVETNQAGVDSPAFQPGPFSPEAEALSIRFVDWYCRAARSYVDAAETRSAAGRRHGLG